MLNNKNLPKKIIALIFFVIIILLLMYRWHNQKYLSTENAYLNADVIQVSPRVTGKIVKVHFSNNQYIKKDQILFEIDSKPYEITAKEAKFQLDKDLAQLNIAKLTAKRLQELSDKNVTSKQENDKAKAILEQAIAAKKYSELILENSLLNLSYTKVYASHSGFITNSSIQPGNIAKANVPLFALIIDNSFWVDANFKETELANIHTNQLVDIKLDMYPKIKLKGKVESISNSTGSAFSLLPPQNATGNWVKVTQRIPVKIKLLNQDTKLPLHIGASAKATVLIG